MLGTTLELLALDQVHEHAVIIHPYIEALALVLAQGQAFSVAHKVKAQLTWKLIFSKVVTRKQFGQNHDQISVCCTKD